MDTTAPDMILKAYNRIGREVTLYLASGGGVLTVLGTITGVNESVDGYVTVENYRHADGSGPVCPRTLVARHEIIDIATSVGA